MLGDVSTSNVTVSVIVPSLALLDCMLALFLVGAQVNGHAIWPLPLPLLFLGLGFVLYYALASERSR